tara:strand:+ start:239 stop:637 length:399 start_codon:yes stop_codon:yes gene_type:complete
LRASGARSADASRRRSASSTASTRTPFDIVFVSSDSSAEDATQHFEHGQGEWVALDWADPLSAKLKRQHRIWSGREVMQFGLNRRSGVPAVVVVDSAGGEVAFMAAERDGASALKSYRSDWRRWPVELADEL